MTTVPRVGPRLHRLRRMVQECVADVPDPLLVACSGGPDSLALAAAAAATGRPVGAIIVDHAIQPDSARVAARVADQCTGLGLAPVTVVRVSVADAAGTGPEAAARQARYRALAQRAEALAAGVVLLGHTRDDQAETVLLGLARGSGIRSLSGMPEVRGRYRRPFLSLSRDQVRAGLAETGLEPWSDPHNEDPAYRRARVRHTVLPVLEEQLGPGIAAALVRTASQARADADALDEWAERARVDWESRDRAAAALTDLPVAVRSRVLLAAARESGSPSNDLTHEHVVELDRLVTDWNGQGPIHLPGRVIAGRRYGRLYFVGANGDSAHSSGIGAADGS